MTLPRQRISGEALRLITALRERDHEALEEFLEPNTSARTLTREATELLYDTWDHVYPSAEANEWARKMADAEDFARERGLL